MPSVREERTYVLRDACSDVQKILEHLREVVGRSQLLKSHEKIDICEFCSFWSLNLAIPGHEQLLLAPPHTSNIGIGGASDLILHALPTNSAP